jgi:hypothetical protein
MSRNLMIRNLRGKAVTGVAVVLCLIVAQLDLQARPGTNDEVSTAVAADPDTSGAGVQPQPTKSPPPRIPRPPLSVTSSLRIPSERVTVAQATNQAGTAPPVKKSSKTKLLIIVAVAAGAATAILLTRKSKPEDAVITVGTPTVGQQ